MRDDLEKLLAAPSPTTLQDTLLVTLTDDWYAAHKAFDAAVIAHDKAGEKDLEKQAEFERAEQRTDALYEQMVKTPAQGLRGIHAKMRAAVYPDQWDAFRTGKLESLDADINPAMFYSLVADVERLSKGAVPIAKSAIEDPVLVLKR